MCVFSDGRVAQRWMVGAGSWVWWDDLDHRYKVHIYAHPDYGKKWLSGPTARSRSYDRLVHLNRIVNLCR